MAGCLIGKAGVNIQKLRSDYGCSVRLPDCPGPERWDTLLLVYNARCLKLLRDKVWKRRDGGTNVPSVPFPIFSVVNPWHLGTDPDPRIRTTDPDPDPAYFVSGWQGANKK